MEDLSESPLTQKKKLKLFPWIKTVNTRFSKSFPADYDLETLNLFLGEVEKEMETVSINSLKKNEALFSTLMGFYNHFCWKIKWKEDSPHMKSSCAKLLSFLSKVGLVLSTGNVESKWLNQVLSALKVFPGDNDSIYSALLHICKLKKKYQPAYSVVLSHMLCCTQHRMEEPSTYFKLMLLFRRLKFLLTNPHERAEIDSFASRVVTPSSTISWLISNNLGELCKIKMKRMGHQLMRKKFSKAILEELREVVLPDMCSEKSVVLEENEYKNADLFFIDFRPEVEKRRTWEEETENIADYNTKTPTSSKKKKLKKNISANSSEMEEGQLDEQLVKSKRKSMKDNDESDDFKVSKKQKKIGLADELNAKKTLNSKQSLIVKKKFAKGDVSNCQQIAIDCINLIDSSDEMSTPSYSDFASKINSNTASNSSKKSKKENKIRHSISQNEIDENVVYQSLNDQPESSFVADEIESDSVKKSKKKKRKSSNFAQEEIHPQEIIKSQSNFNENDSDSVESIKGSKMKKRKTLNITQEIDSKVIIESQSSKSSYNSTPDHINSASKKNKKKKTSSLKPDDHQLTSSNKVESFNKDSTSEGDASNCLFYIDDVPTTKRLSAFKKYLKEKEQESMATEEENNFLALSANEVLESSFKLDEQRTSIKINKQKSHQKEAVDTIENNEVDEEPEISMPPEKHTNIKKIKHTAVVTPSKGKLVIDYTKDTSINVIVVDSEPDSSSIKGNTKVDAENRIAESNAVAEAICTLDDANPNNSIDEAYIESIDKTEIKCTDEAKAVKSIAETEALETISETEAIENVTEPDAVDNAAQVEAVENAAEVEAVENAAEVEAVENAAEVEAVKDIAEVEAAENIAEVGAVENAAEVEAVDKASEVEAVENIAEVEAVENVAEVEAVENIAEVEAVENVAETEAVENIPETEAVETIAEMEALDNIAETKAEENIAKTEAVVIVAKAEVVENVAEMKEVENIAETEAVGNTAQVEAVKNIAEMKAVENTAEAETVENISEVEAVQNIAEMGAAKIVAEVETVENVAEVEAVENVAEVEAVENVAEVEAVDIIAEVEAVENIAEVEAVENIAEVEAVENIAEVKAVENIVEVEAAENIAEVEAVENIAEVEAAENIAEVEAVESIAEVEAAENVAEVEAVENVAETEAVENIAETEAVDNVAETEAVDNVAETEAVEIAAETKLVENIAEAETVCISKVRNELKGVVKEGSTSDDKIQDQNMETSQLSEEDYCKILLKEVTEDKFEDDSEVEVVDDSESTPCSESRNTIPNISFTLKSSEENIPSSVDESEVHVDKASSTIGADFVTDNGNKVSSKETETVESVAESLYKKILKAKEERTTPKSCVLKKTAADILTENTVNYVMEKVIGKVECVDNVAKEQSFEDLKSIKKDIKFTPERSQLPKLGNLSNLKTFGFPNEKSECLSFVDVLQENVRDSTEIEDVHSPARRKDFYPYRNLLAIDVPDDKSESNFSDFVASDKLDDTICVSDESTSSDSDDEIMETNDTSGSPACSREDVVEDIIVENSPLKENEAIIDEPIIPKTSKNDKQKLNIHTSPNISTISSSEESELTRADTGTVEESRRDSGELISLVQTIKVPIINLGSRCDDESFKNQKDAGSKDFDNGTDVDNDFVSDKSEKENSEKGNGVEVAIKNQSPTNDKTSLHNQESNDTGSGEVSEKLASDNVDAVTTRKLRQRNVSASVTDKSENAAQKQQTPERSRRTRLRRKPSSQETLQSTESEAAASSTVVSSCRSSKRLKKDINIKLRNEFNELRLDSPKAKRRNPIVVEIDDISADSDVNGESLKVEKRTTRSSAANSKACPNTKAELDHDDLSVEVENEEACSDEKESKVTRRTKRSITSKITKYFSSKNKVDLTPVTEKEVEDEDTNSVESLTENFTVKTRSTRSASVMSDVGDSKSKTELESSPIDEEETEVEDNKARSNNVKSSKDIGRTVRRSKRGTSVTSEKGCSESKLSQKPIDEESDGEDVDACSTVSEESLKENTTVEEDKDYCTKSKPVKSSARAYNLRSKRILIRPSKLNILKKSEDNHS